MVEWNENHSESCSNLSNHQDWEDWKTLTGSYHWEVLRSNTRPYSLLAKLRNLHVHAWLRPTHHKKCWNVSRTCQSVSKRGLGWKHWKQVQSREESKPSNTPFDRVTHRFTNSIKETTKMRLVEALTIHVHLSFQDIFFGHKKFVKTAFRRLQWLRSMIFFYFFSYLDISRCSMSFYEF